MADMKIVPVYRGNEMVLPITGVNAVMDGEGNNLPMIFAKKDATTSDAWDPDITYTTGQYCLDNNTLWRCLIQNENTKPEEGTYWTRETIGNNLVTTDGEGNRGYLKADGSFSPFSSSSEMIEDYRYESNTHNSGVTFQTSESGEFWVLIVITSGWHLLDFTKTIDGNDLNPIIETKGGVSSSNGVETRMYVSSYKGHIDKGKDIVLGNFSNDSYNHTYLRILLLRSK